MSEISRRDILVRLAATVAAAGVIDRVAAQQVHDMVGQARTAGGYEPKALSTHEFATVARLSDLIIPAEDGAPGALAAEVPAWIDLIVGSNDRLKSIYSDGVAWIDKAMTSRGAANFVDGTPEQQTALLDTIAFRRNSTPGLAPGVEFFSWVRRMVVDGFYTSRVGMRDIYLGNTAQATFTVPQDAIDYALKRSGL